MTRGWVAVTIAASLLVAGFVGGAGISGLLDDGTNTPKNDGQDVEYPPGLSSEGVANESRLIAAHNERLLQQGFVTTLSTSFTKDGDRSESSRQYAVAANQSSFRIVSRNASTGDVTLEYWGNETWAVSRHWEKTLTGRILDYDAGESGELFRVSGAEVLEVDLRNADFNVTDVIERNGTTMFVLQSNYISYDLGGESQGSDWHYDARMVVDSDGRVHSFESIRRSTVPGDNRTFTNSYQIRTLGDVTPKKPSWIDEVPEFAFIDASVNTDDVWRKYIKIEHTRGDPLPPSTVFEFATNGSVYSVQLGERLRPGETRYVYVADGTAHVIANRTEAAERGTCLGDRLVTKLYIKSPQPGSQVGHSLQASAGTTDFPCKIPETETER